MTTSRNHNELGMTLLEVLVATVIMAIAVVGLFTNLSTSLRAAAKLTNYDRATMLARTKMDELLAQTRLPKGAVLEGVFDPATTGHQQSGWRAIVRPFEALPNPSPGMVALDRVELEIWWMTGEERKTFTLDALKRVVLEPQDVAPGPQLR